MIRMGMGFQDQRNRDPFLPRPAAWQDQRPDS
jgi:hypothetical protein